MLGPALGWLASARQCFDDPYGALTRGLLTSAFALVVGLGRVFHLEQMEDQGFARLTGGRRCPSRYSVGGWRRHLPWYEVDAFCRRTSPWHLIAGDAALVRYDEHTIPRWTHKFHIPKGYVTTRNKHRRCEKLFYTYDLASGRYLAVRATPGDWGLIDLAVPLARQTLERGQPEYLHALFDAGAGHSDAGVRALWNLAQEDDPRLDVTLRACRYPHRVGVHDEFLDAVPCGYDKDSPNSKRPRFPRGPLQMLGWLVALVYNAVGDLAASLAGDYAGSHVGTMRRQFFNRPGALYETPEALVVRLERFAGQEALIPVIDEFNAAGHRLPWLEDRRVVVSLTPNGQPRSGP